MKIIYQMNKDHVVSSSNSSDDMVVFLFNIDVPDTVQDHGIFKAKSQIMSDDELVASSTIWLSVIPEKTNFDGSTRKRLYAVRFPFPKKHLGDDFVYERHILIIESITPSDMKEFAELRSNIGVEN